MIRLLLNRVGAAVNRFHVDVDELDVDEFGELSGSGSLNIETA